MIGVESETGFSQLDGTPVPDAALSPTSTNAVQNKVITEKINLISSYSTEETVVGKWTDGSPVYRRVYYFTTATADNNDGVLTQYMTPTEAISVYQKTITIPNDIVFVVRQQGGISANQSNHGYVPIPIFYNCNQISNVWINTSAHQLNIRTKGYEGLPGFIIIEYLKHYV
jgi:hypothetical protein